MKTLAEKIAVMQAAERGEKIEYRTNDLNAINAKYMFVLDPVWNWDSGDYRVITRVLQVPDVPMFWVRSPLSQNNVWMPEGIEGDRVLVPQKCSTGSPHNHIDLTTWQWSADRKTWYNFYGEQVT
jgi:hypothetical protein